MGERRADADMMSWRHGADVKGRRVVCGFSRTTFGPERFWGGGLQTHREDDAWRGYDSETAHPPDANLWRIVIWNRLPTVDLWSGISEGGRGDGSDGWLGTGPARI